jgi:hypothetical protein
MKIFTLLGASLCLAGCVTQKVTDSNLNAVTVCSAGASSAVDAKLEAKIAQNIRDGVSVDAGITQELKGSFINNAKVSEANAVSLYDKYLSCLKQIRP